MVTPFNKRTNKAERAIQTFKQHFGSRPNGRHRGVRGVGRVEWVGVNRKSTHNHVEPFMFLVAPDSEGVGGGKCKVEITSAERQQDVSRVVTLVAGHMQGCLTSSHQVHFVHVWSPRASSPRAAHQCQESDIGGASQDFMESQGYEACQVAGAERGFSSDAAAKI